jgi:hypothetical protein
MIFKKGDIVGWRNETTFIGIVREVVIGPPTTTVVEWLDADPTASQKTFHPEDDQILFFIVQANHNCHAEKHK